MPQAKSSIPNFLYKKGHASRRVFRRTIPINLPMAKGVASLSASIVTVALYGVNPAVFRLFHETYMIHIAVPVPVEEYDIPGAWLVMAVLPQAPGFEPILAGANRRTWESPPPPDTRIGWRTN